MQGVVLALLLYFGGSLTLFAGASKPQCFVSLSRDVLKHTQIKHSSVKPNFSTLINKERAKLLTDYYRKTPKKKIYRLGVQILRDLLSDTGHLIEPTRRIPFLYSVKHFMERGGALL